MQMDSKIWCVHKTIKFYAYFSCGEKICFGLY